MISRVASRSPPGVLIRTSSSASWSSCACAMACPTISTVMGWISPSMDTATTRGPVPCASADTVSVSERNAIAPHRSSILVHLEIRRPRDFLTGGVHRRYFQLIRSCLQRTERKFSTLLRNTQLGQSGVPLRRPCLALQDSHLSAHRRRIRRVNFEIKKRLLRFDELIDAGRYHLHTLRHQRSPVARQRNAGNQAHIRRWMRLPAENQAAQGYFSLFARWHVQRRFRFPETLAAGTKGHRKAVLAGSDFEFLFV